MPQGEAYGWCEACGARFEDRSRGGRRRWCGEACRNWALHHPGERRPAARTCPACGTVFAWNGRQEFCSRLCSNVFRGSLKIGPQGGVIVCAICGKRKAVYNPGWDRVCRGCVREWEARRAREWAEANLERVREWYRQRSRKPEYRAYMAAYMRRRRAAGLSGEGPGVAAVLAQYGSVCHLCLQPIEAGADPRGPRAATRDHVVPVSKGGPNVIENLRPAHRSCNVWKGTKSLEEYLEPPVDVEML